MNQRIDLTQLDGIGMTQNMLDFMQVSYRQAFGALAAAFGNKVIISGVIESGANLTDGWVVIDGELLPFVGGSKAGNIITNEISGLEQFSDLSVKTVYFTKFAQPGAIGGYLYTDFVRLSTIQTIFQNLQQLTQDFNNYLPDWADVQNKPTIPEQLIIRVASFQLGDAPDADGIFTIAFADVGTDNYIVTGSLRSTGSQWNSDNDVFWMARGNTRTQFQLLTREVSKSTQSLRFDYALIKLA